MKDLIGPVEKNIGRLSIQPQVRPVHYARAVRWELAPWARNEAEVAKAVPFGTPQKTFSQCHAQLQDTCH